jgi:hypothetical protein
MSTKKLPSETTKALIKKDTIVESNVEEVEPEGFNLIDMN